MAAADVGVELGGGRAGVTEKLLYASKVSTILQKMRGEAMSQSVGRERFVYSCIPGNAFYDPPYMGAVNPLSPVIQKEG